MTDFRQLPIADAIRYLETHGEPPDRRTDIDTASLITAFPELGRVRITELSIPGPHGDRAARMYRVPGEPITAGFAWAHGGAFIGGHLDMPESRWVGLSLAARHGHLDQPYSPEGQASVRRIFEWLTR